MSECKRIGFDKIIGQETAVKTLKKAVRANQPAHAYLFLGFSGTGKCTTALEFAKALNCLNQIDGNACEECSNCLAFEHGNSPDIILWQPEKQNTTIDQMRKMREESIFGPLEGKWKVNIIEQGDTLNEESANCILKLLEEPPAYMVNILIYKNAAALLPTIRSRTQLIRFVQVSADILIQRLIEEHNITEKQAAFFTAYSQGCPGKAINLVTNSDFKSKRNAINEAARIYASGDISYALALSEVLKTGAVDTDEDDDNDDATQATAKTKNVRKKVKDTVIESLDMLVLLYRDMLAVKASGSNASLVNVDIPDQIDSAVSRFSDYENIVKSIEAIITAKRNILANANAQVCIDSLSIKLLMLARA